MPKAILVADATDPYSALVSTIRPLKAVQNPDDKTWDVTDPLTNRVVKLEDHQVVVQGDWDDLSVYSLGGEKVTWRQYAKHQLGQVLRQNELATRLREMGVQRQNEPYIHLHSAENNYHYQFRFSFDEVEILLNGNVQA